MAKRLLLLAALSIGACRGDTSEQPPVHLQQNMDFQERFDMQESNAFFWDGRAMRPPVEGTVAIGELRTDDHLHRGQALEVENGTTSGDLAFVRKLPPRDAHERPIVPDRAFLDRGRERFGIYCVPCHGATGDGQGIVVKRGMVVPPSFYEDRLLGMPVGQFYDVITNGARNMPAYGAQIPVRDRWAIAAYVRVLQRRRAAPFDMVPKEEASSRGWTKP
ncbi:MAG: cytochrome c [Deltaproteobacteria bacterium]